MKTVVNFLFSNFFVATGLPFIQFGGRNGDDQMAPNDDGYSTLDLNYKLPFFGKIYKKLWINNNGVISFASSFTNHTPNCSSVGTPMITPFWADIKTFPNDSGNVYYRQSQSPELLATLANEIRQTNSSLRSLRLTNAIVVTWFNVSFYLVQSCSFKSSHFWPRNTFQVIVATDDVRTFVIFNYHQILWVTGGYNCGSGSVSDRTPAKIGFDSGNGKDFEVVAGSCSDSISTIVNKSNIGIPGKFIFRVDNTISTRKPRATTIPTRWPKVATAMARLVATASTLQPHVAIASRQRSPAPSALAERSTASTVFFIAEHSDDKGRASSIISCVFPIDSRCSGNIAIVMTVVSIIMVVVISPIVFIFVRLWRHNESHQYDLVAAVSN